MVPLGGDKAPLLKKKWVNAGAAVLPEALAGTRKPSRVHTHTCTHTTTAAADGPLRPHQQHVRPEEEGPGNGLQAAQLAQLLVHVNFAQQDLEARVDGVVKCLRARGAPHRQRGGV